MKRVLLLVGLVLTLTGCATQFTGSAHVKGGADACKAKCSDQGLEFAGMVYMGEYTDGCICAAPGKRAEALKGAQGVVAGAIGVVLNMREAQQQQSLESNQQFMQDMNQGY
jgi:hypothetical protein